jgi:methyl-accepting chemotaxis protein/methyl-accepting chemotaxis protein-1 (serine sensor receptor)
MTLANKISSSFAAAAGLQVVAVSLLFTSSTRTGTLVLQASAILVCIVLAFLAKSFVKSDLGLLVEEISTGADQVRSAATQIAGASQSLAQGTSEQAASLEETSASTEEINSMARRNSENSHSAADLVKASDQRFAETNRFLQEMIAAMSEINASSDKISKIIKVIDDIAFQTNILALNAAVEAARAGDAGMGFAVVADEVRNLAQRSAQAARDTAVLIEESIAKSNEGQQRTEQVAKSIHTITEQSRQVRTLVDEVHLGSQEQTRGIEQIGKAMVHMEQVTQRAAASAEESASAAEELTAQSAGLRDIVERLSRAIGLAHASHATSLVRHGVTPAKRADSKAPSSSGLTALSSAVSRKAAKPVAESAVASGNDAFPMDDNFTEF